MESKGRIPYPQSVGIYFHHPSSARHDTGSHPERAARLVAIEAALDEAGWPGLERAQPEPATRAQLELVHRPEHVSAIERFCAAGGGLIDMDTVAVAASWEAALRASGAAVEGAARLLAGETDFVFAAMRPPGHHAESARAMGFCLFNSIAVGAASAIAEGGAERVLILDWDVHHGNGTQEIFAARDDVLYVSIHQDPLYPGTGQASEIGAGAGRGYTLNLPVGAGADGELFLALVQHVVAPVAREWRPDLIAVSTGYDAHAEDPLADCRLLDGDYRALAAAVRELSSELDAPLLFCLEGGYELGALSRSVVETVRALDSEEEAPRADPARIAETRRRLEPLWPAALAG